MTPWPAVANNDDGIRPAGPPNECFFCQQKVGEEHARDCVCVTKRVLVEYKYLVEVDVPHYWDTHDIEFHRNDSSWCADNGIEDLKREAERLNCLCSVFEARFIKVIDNTPKRELASEESLELSNKIRSLLTKGESP